MSLPDYRHLDRQDRHQARAREIQQRTGWEWDRCYDHAVGGTADHLIDILKANDVDLSGPSAPDGGADGR